MKKIILIILAALSFTACDIDRLPYGSMAAEKITADPNSSLESLLNGCYAQLKHWSDPMHRCGEYAGDNICIRNTSTDAFYEFISFSRTPQNYRLQNFWDYSYKAIAQASNIINMIAEGQSQEIDGKLGECYYIRGMLYFYLCRAYGPPYYQNPEKNLGVPIVNGTPDDMQNLNLPDRATVKETYAQVISDLRKATKMISTNKGAIYASKEAAQAMLSRVYLYMSGTYENPDATYADSAAYFATQVIESGKYKLLSREQFMKYNTFAPESNSETIFAIKRLDSEYSGYDYYYTVGGMYANLGGMGWGEMYSSATYINLLNETGRNDWRPGSHYQIVDARAAFIEPTYSKDDNGNYTEVFRFIRPINSTTKQYAQFYTTHQADGNIYCAASKETSAAKYKLTPVNASQGIYTIEYEGATYEGFIDWYISLNNGHPQFYITKCSREDNTECHLHSPLISRLGEIYLNRAEAYAKQGKYDLALADLNTIRNRAIVNGGYASLDVSNAGERIDKERQLELAFQAERSYDVFRNGGTLKRFYPGAHPQTLEIPATDYRVVYYIPQDAINSYPGTLTQNPTSN